MRQAFNVIIDRDYLGPEPATVQTVDSRGAAEQALRDDLKAFKGDTSQWRGFIEEVYVAGDEEFKQEARRVQWHVEEIRAQKAEERRLAAMSDQEHRERSIAAFPETMELLRCDTCGWQAQEQPLVAYPGSHRSPMGQPCVGAVRTIVEDVTVTDPYGNIVKGPGSEEWAAGVEAAATMPADQPEGDAP